MKGRGLAIILGAKKPMDDDEEEAPPSSKREQEGASAELEPLLKAQWDCMKRGDFKKAAKIEAEIHRICDSYMDDDEGEEVGEDDKDEEKY